TYPAYTPNYWIGGFSCFDCHSPHANPARLLGFNDLGQPVGLVDTETAYGTLNKTYSIANPGHDGRTENNYKFYSANPAEREPVYLAGSWLLIKNADREIAVRDDADAVGLDGASGAYVAKPVTAGQEISDSIMAGLHQYDTDTAYPVNKVPIDWNDPIGAAGSAAVGNENKGYDQLGLKNIWNVSEFCTDCHDGNAGLHTVQAPLFSEDRALRGSQSANGDDTNFKGSYDLAYGHDAQPRH
ncbi:MAG: hypothetical protein K6T91_11050, partial [Firmicutes bacterium]|nr:hypothetical protein [Bacillota bacterium]